MVRKASWGLGVAQLPCRLPLLEDKNKFSVLLAFPSAFKGSEARRWQSFLFRAKESSLSATWVEWSCFLSAWVLILHYGYLQKRKLARGAPFLMLPVYSTNRSHQFCSSPPDSIYSTSAAFPIFGFQVRAREGQSFLRSGDGQSVPGKSGCSEK